MKYKKYNFHFISSLTAGFIFSSFLLYNFLIIKEINPEEDLLNPGTSVLFESADGIKIHCKGYSDINECIDFYKKNNVESLSVWFGNSQLHAINQYKNGQKTSTLLLNELLKNKGDNLFTLSFGNANIIEHSIQLIYLINQINIDRVILSLVFDDSREGELRDDVFKFIEIDSFTSETLKKYKSGQKLINDKNSNILEYESSKNLQILLESYLDESLNSISELWNQRSEISYYFFTTLRKIRNYIFNIKPTTIRKIIPKNYDKNLNFLEIFLEESLINKVDVIMYIAPIRNDIDLPYLDDEYLKFKKDIYSMSKLYNNVTYLNLEDIVPPENWGQKNSTTLNDDLELDFMHFNYEGHLILANKLDSILN